jgi:signal transduction histidine kinase
MAREDKERGEGGWWRRAQPSSNTHRGAAPLPSILRFRSAALSQSVILAWLMVAVLATIGFVEMPYDRQRLIAVAGGFVIVLALGTAANWQNILKRPVGPWLAWSWATLLTLGLGAMATIPEMYTATFPLFAGIVVLTGLTLEPVRHAVVAALAVLLMLVIGAFVVPAELKTAQSLGVITGERANENTPEPADIVIPALTVAVVAAATGFFGAEFQREAERSNQRLTELNEQRQDFERLYAVTATLAGAESLTEGLPEIVGTICRYLGAQVGVVFLYHPDDHALKVMSPMWVNGHTLDVGDSRIPIATGGIVPQVFRSGKPILLDRVPENADQFSVIGELGLSQAMIAPLRVEGFNVGAIAVGDPIEGSFAAQQLEVFSSLAAPAALVLSQLGRYEAAAEMTRRMQEIAQMKTDFVSVVSHELRTPLTSIIGSLDTVGRPELSEALAKDLLDSARRQAGRLQRLIEDLLMVSRIDRQSIPVASESVTIKPVLDDVARTVGEDQDLIISVEPSQLQVTADPDHLRRVFINLVENAIKYAPGSPVELVARPMRERVDIDVIDHGEGIPPSERKRIFEPFTQMERSDTRTKGGTGLGLSIVKGLVEAMHGTVILTDTSGGGATFTISLPPAGTLLATDGRSSDLRARVRR